MRAGQTGHATHRQTLKDEDQDAGEMAEHAGHQHQPDHGPEGPLLVRRHDPEVRETQGDLEAGDADHVEGSSGEVDLDVVPVQRVGVGGLGAPVVTAHAARSLGGGGGP